MGNPLYDTGPTDHENKNISSENGIYNQVVTFARKYTNTYTTHKWSINEQLPKEKTRIPVYCTSEGLGPVLQLTGARYS